MNPFGQSLRRVHDTIYRHRFKFIVVGLIIMAGGELLLAERWSATSLVLGMSLIGPMLFLESLHYLADYSGLSSDTRFSQGQNSSP